MTSQSILAVAALNVPLAEALAAKSWGKVRRPWCGGPIRKQSNFWGSRSPPALVRAHIVRIGLRLGILILLQ